MRYRHPPIFWIIVGLLWGMAAVLRIVDGKTASAAVLVATCIGFCAFGIGLCLKEKRAHKK